MDRAQQIAQVKVPGGRTGHLSIIGKGVGDAGEGVDLFEQGFAHALDQFGSIGRTQLLRPLQMLHTQAHGREWVFDFMGHLPGHFTPGHFSFGLFEAFHAGIQVAEGLVVGIDQVAQLIAVLVAQALVLAQNQLAQTHPDLTDWGRDAPRYPNGHGGGNEEEKDITGGEDIQKLVDAGLGWFLKVKVGDQKHQNQSPRDQ